MIVMSLKALFFSRSIIAANFHATAVSWCSGVTLSGGDHNMCVHISDTAVHISVCIQSLTLDPEPIM